jgi:hypothetical protein
MVSGGNLSGKSQYSYIWIAGGTDSILESPGSAMVEFLRCCVSVAVKQPRSLGESKIYKSCGV